MASLEAVDNTGPSVLNSPEVQLEGTAEAGGVKLIFVTRYVMLERPASLGDVIPFMLVFFVYGLVIHICLTGWRRLHARSYGFFQLLAVLGFPPVMLVLLRDRFFLAIWFGFLCAVLVLLKRVLWGSMNSAMPREIYAFFRGFFIITNILILTGQLLTLAVFTFYPEFILRTVWLLLYALYIAVMGREVVLNLSHLMAIRAGYFSKEGLPAVRENADVCMICTAPLASTSHLVSLHCGHSFHGDCIRGWCLIGQNKFCPYCKHGIDSSIFEQDIFDKIELPFKQLMNFLRSSITLFIIMYCIFAWKMR